MASVQVWLIDQPGKNLNVRRTLGGAARTIADLRAAGHTVFVHCVEARSRTAAVATLYGAAPPRRAARQAWADIEATLPGFDPQPFLRDAVDDAAVESHVGVSALGRPSTRPGRDPLSIHDDRRRRHRPCSETCGSSIGTAGRCARPSRRRCRGARTPSWRPAPSVVDRTGDARADHRHERATRGAHGCRRRRPAAEARAARGRPPGPGRRLAPCVGSW